MNAGKKVTFQFSMTLREELRKELTRRAFEADMTIKGFVLNALRAQGLHVRDDEITDRRSIWREEKTLSLAE